MESCLQQVNQRNTLQWRMVLEAKIQRQDELIKVLIVGQLQLWYCVYHVTAHHLHNCYDSRAMTGFNRHPRSYLGRNKPILSEIISVNFHL